jgi:O-antigen ligase
LAEVSDRAGVSWGALVLAAALPVVYLHADYQPTFSLDAGSTSVDIALSDLAVLAVAVAAIAAALTNGLGRLRPALLMWIVGALLLAWVAFETLRPLARDDPEWADQVVSAAKLAQYATLAVAVPLLVRRLEELAVVLWVLTAWCAVAAAVAVAQFFGLDVFDAWQAGWRQPSFVGHHDLASLGALSLAVGLAALLVGRGLLPSPTLLPVALAGGMLALVLSGSVAAAGGLVLAGVVLVAAAWRRFAPSWRQLAALAAVVVTVTGGVVALRADPLESFLVFLGVREEQPVQGIETYSQRSVLAYIGLRIFADNPILGVGWQRSSQPDEFMPYVDDARRRFPTVDDQAFPAPGREWGVQNAYIQSLADLGLPGFVLLLGLFGSGVVLALRAAARAPARWAATTGLGSLGAIVTLMGIWASVGLVSGIPLQASTSLALGLAATGAAAAWETRTDA